MAQAKNIKASEFDTVVIGGGISGLLAAHRLEETGRKVALIEALEFVGGNCRPSDSPIGAIDHGLKFFANTPKSEATLQWLEEVLQQPLERKLIEAPPVTFDNGKFRPFVGFGDDAAEAAIEIDYYAKPQYWQLSQTPKDWVQLLSQSFTGELMLQSHVTKLQVEDEFVIELTLNGAKRVTAREFVFCAPPQQLLRLLPESHLPTRLRQKLAKGSVFTSLHLDLIHGQEVTPSQSMHILRGANEEPCWGLFQAVRNTEDGKTFQQSQWVTLIANDQTNDDELVATALKKIKRQLKRAYPEALDQLLHERILVCPGSHGDVGAALSENLTWPKLQNLWIISSFFSSEKNILGALEQCHEAIAHMGATPPIQDIAIEDHNEPSPTMLS